MSTTTTTMRASQRVLLEAFPAPPSHIPQGHANPPPSGPPSFPLPPVPGPSRVSIDDQLLFLSSVVQRSRRSSRYSNRESIISVSSGGHGSGTETSSRRTSVAIPGSPISKVFNVSPTLTTSQRDSMASTRSSTHSTSSSFTRPSISVSAATASGNGLTAAEQSRLAVSPMLLSDIEDDETEAMSPRVPSPFLDSSWRRSKHRHNESISSIDVLDILSVDADGTDEPLDDPPPPILSRRLSSRPSPPIPHSFEDSITPFSSLPTTTASENYHSFKNMNTPKNSIQLLPTDTSSSDTSSSLFSTTSSSTSIYESSTNVEAVLSSPTIKDLRLEIRAERTKSPGLRKELIGRNRSRSRAGNRVLSLDAPDVPPISSDVGLESDTASIKTAVLVAENASEPRKDDMTLEELGPLPTPTAADTPIKTKKTTRSRAGTVSSAVKVAFPLQKSSSSPQTEEPPRTPSPDIDTILLSTPRPVLKKSTRTRVQSQGIIRKPLDSATSNWSTRRRASEGILPDGRATMSWPGHGQDGSDLADLQSNKTWRRCSTGDDEVSERLDEGLLDEFPNAAGDTTKDTGEDSDSSIDLHTPLPHLMVRDGLLSPNSRLLPSSLRSLKRSDSIMTTASVITKSGIMKDERDTPMRRVRHRDNRLLKGGIGLTTGLGWSDSEDEDAPSPLTRRLSVLNLSRRSSASSIKTISSVVSRRHPLSRSYSSGALVESEQEQLDVLNEDLPSIPARPRLPSSSRISRTSLPPTSWQHKSTAPNRNSGGTTRTSTSSVGSSFSFDGTIQDSVRLRPSKISRPGSGLRDSSGSENYERVLAVKRQSAEDRTSSSTTSSGSIIMPVTPKDYDPTMSSPAHLGAKLYDKEKSLPPLPIPQGVLKKKRSDARPDSPPSIYGIPRPTFSASSNSNTSPTSAATILGFETKPSGVRPLQLPRQAGRPGTDRPAVPVPSIITSVSQSSSYRSPPSQPSPTLSQPETPASPPGSAIRPRPRTGTGMTYRTSSVGSRIKVPMTLASASGFTGKIGMADGLGSIHRASGKRIPPL